MDRISITLGEGVMGSWGLMMEGDFHTSNTTTHNTHLLTINKSHFIHSNKLTQFQFPNTALLAIRTLLLFLLFMMRIIVERLFTHGFLEFHCSVAEAFGLRRFNCLDTLAKGQVFGWVVRTNQRMRCLLYI